MQERKRKAVLYDRDIREPLFDYLEERYGKTRMFEEKVIGKSRADILMLTETALVGLEIKSDADTYDRLKRQVRDYNKYCDFNYIVIGKSHERHVEEHIPKSWGILTAALPGAGDGLVIEEKREPAPNAKCKNELQLTLLWKLELYHLLELNGLPKYRQKSKAFIRKKLLERVAWETLKGQVCEELFERDYTLHDFENEDD